MSNSRSPVIIRRISSYDCLNFFLHISYINSSVIRLFQVRLSGCAPGEAEPRLELSRQECSAN